MQLRPPPSSAARPGPAGLIPAGLVPAGLCLLLLASCGPIPPDRAAERCEARARAAEGPTGRVTVGTNSSDGPFTEAEISLSGDFLAGRDPRDVYTRCVVDLTGAPPIRPPRLRTP